MFQRVADIAEQGRQDLPDSFSRSPTAWSLDALGKIETNLPVIMRKKDAETDPNQQITTNVGSGPFMFNETETKSGQRYVYDK